MYRDVESQALIGPAQQLTGQNQMRRAGNRQEFRQPLNQSQNDDVQRFHRQSLVINRQTGVFMLRRQQCTGIDENFARRVDATWYADKAPVYLARFSPTGMLYL